MLKICIEFDTFIYQEYSRRQALDVLKGRAREFYPPVLAALESIEVADLGTEEREISVRDLTDTMILAQDVRTKAGLLVVPKGQKLTLSMRILLENYAQRNEIEKKMRVLVSSGAVQPRPVTH